MGVEPVQIHVMSAISGVTWEEAWEGHLLAQPADAPAPTIQVVLDWRALQGAGRP